MNPDSIDAQVSRVLSQHLGPDARVGVAVSGGGDSVALMHLAAAWASHMGVELRVATVDHQLRDGSTAEANAVGGTATRLSLPHDVLIWSGWDGSGNLQEAAREARAKLLVEWARRNGLSTLLLGHTQDDQAETFLMRLARGSGVDGLSAMSEAREADGILWLRPLLNLSRAELRDWMQARDIPWIDDPSNDDDRFARVRLRKAAGAFADLGLSADRLSTAATSMARARVALEARAQDVARRIADVSYGVLHFDGSALATIEPETRLRLLAQGLKWTASAAYRPRLASLEAVLAQTLEGHAATLHGCLLQPHKGRLVIAREYAAVADHRVPAGAVWDSRWHLGEANQAAEIAPLGDLGVQTLELRPAELPRAALLSLPALWAKGTVIAVPALSPEVSDQVYTLPDKHSFLEGLIAH